MQSKHNEKIVILGMESQDDAFCFSHSIQDALTAAEEELLIVHENIHSINSLKPDCDKNDYAVVAGSGAPCGLIDIFLVGKPGETPLGDITDKWLESRTMDFAKLCGWDSPDNKTLFSAVRFFEKKFKIPCDQRGAGDAESFIFDLSPANHHFKSLGHNLTILGLFFSVLDQFTNSSPFVTEGKLISLVDADNSFEL